MKKITLFFLVMFSSFMGFSQLPEGFEGTSLPDYTSDDWVLTSGTWKVFDNGIGLAQSWTANTVAANVYAGSRSGYLNREAVAPGTFAEDWLVTHQITVPNNAQLRFWTRQTLAGNQGSIYTIRVSTTSQTDVNSFTTIQTWTETEMNTTYNVYEEKVVSLSGAGYPSGTPLYIAFVMTNNNGDRWLIDDVNVVEQCLDPTTQTATNPTLTTSDLGWDNPSGASQWEVEVVATGATPTGAGTVVNTNPYTQTGLTAGTCYDFYVRALCVTGSVSEWIGPYNFCTSSLGETCGAPIPVPDLANGPFVDSSNTSNYGDDYSGSPGSGCGTTGTYLNGDDVFYSFTATSTNTVTITSQTNSTWSGLFVYSSCANIGVSCVAGNTSGNGNTTADSVTFTQVIGQTYYIVISTWAAPQSVPYTIEIKENTCTNMTASFAVVSNCFSATDPDTFFVTATVTNMGSATSIVGTTVPASTTATITAPGTIQFGPFPIDPTNGNPYTIHLENASDVNCFKNSNALNQTFCPAPNNLCTDAIPITCNSTITDTTQGATTAGAPTTACGTGSGSGGVWYTYAGNGDVVTFSLCGSAYDTKIQVYTGSCGAFTCVTGNDDFAGCGTSSQVQVTTIPGTTYYVYVFGFGTAQGVFTLNTTCITPPPPPANDNCDTAAAVTVNTDGSCTQLTAGTVTGATPSTQPNGCLGSADDDVWFSFTATQATHTITIQDVVGSVTDVNHVVYTSTNATNPCGNLTQVLCSDPNFSIVYSYVPGQVYYIRVYTATATPLQDTTFNVCVSVPPPPPSNDSCATPLTAPVNPGNNCALIVSGTVSSATASPEPNACGGTANDDVWFEFTATNSSHIISLSNILGTTTDLNFAVYSGSCGTLTQIDCSLPNSSTVNNLVPGSVYKIRVYTATGAVGQFVNFDLCVGSPPLSLDNTTYTVTQLITDVLIDSPCAQVTNVTWKTGNTNNYGSTNGIAYFQENAPGVLPFPNGIVMSTGNAMRSSGPNDVTLSDGNQAWTGDTDLEAIITAATGQVMNSRNATVIEFDFMPLTSNISFDFMFASEEYGTFQCSFSDSFAFLLTDLTTSVTTNLAIVPNTTTPISVVTVRDAAYNTGCASVNASYFDVFNGGANAATAPTNYNGQTVQFTAASAVTPLTQYHIKMVIADRSDNAYDSAVFLKAGSFDIGNIDLGDDFLLVDGTAICYGENYLIESGLDPTLYNFTWSNANGIIPGETGPNLNVTGQGEYTINAEYIGSTCIASDSIIIEYYPELITGVPNNLIVCNSTGFATFDLTENETILLNGLNPADFSVNYYLTQADADAGVNQITNPTSYTNVVQFTQPIFVSVQNILEGCYKITDFDLLIQDLTPQFTLTNDFSICENSTGTITVTPINFADADVTYTWTLDSNPLPDATGSITVSQPGVYTVLVDNNGCTATMSCTVSITPTPVPDAPSDVVECDSYVLPSLTVGNYYTATNGGGTMLAAGDVISSTQMLYVYAESGVAPNICSAENSFTVTINTATADVLNDVTSCDSYVLSTLSSNNNYYTGPSGTGTMLSAGDVISTTQMLYVYAESNTTPNCTDESSFTITIVPTPVAQVLPNVEVCQGTPYVLPSLDPNNSYYTGPSGTGSMLSAGDAINSTQTIYIYAQSGSTPNCTDESSFMVDVIDLPVIELEGGCVDNVYTISATVITGESVTYEWSDEFGVISGANGSSINVNQDGSYSCTVRLSTGQLCESDTVFFLANGTLCTIQKGISPNGDGLNDNFDLTGLNVKKLEIFNRYGRKVYSYSNYVDQWYGQSDKGDELPTGTYYFVIERDNVEAKSGWIYINRQ